MPGDIGLAAGDSENTLVGSSEPNKIRDAFALIFDEKNNIFQIFINEMPDVMLEPRRKITSLAALIDTDKFVCAVVSGKFINYIGEKHGGHDFRECLEIFPEGIPVKYVLASATADDTGVSIDVKIDLTPAMK